MPNTTPLYTGQNAGFNPKPFSATQRAGEQLSKGLVEAKKTEVAYARQDAKEFADLMDTDPVSVASDAVMAKQAQDVQAFIDAGTEMTKGSRGKPSENDKMTLRSMKNKIEADQERYQGEYKQVLNAMQTYSRDPKSYNQAAFTKSIKKYNETGEWDGAALQAGASSYDDYRDRIAKNAKRNDMIRSEAVTDPNTRVTTWTKRSRWTEEEARADYERSILSNDSDRLLVEERFAELNQIEKERLFDEADGKNDGVWNKEDQVNAITNYGWEQDGRESYMIDPYTTRTSGGSSSGDKTTAAMKDEQAQKDRLAPEYMSKNGVSFKDNSHPDYSWQPVAEGYAFRYKKEDSKGVPISSDVLSGIIPDGYIAAGDANKIKPLQLYKDGKVDAYVNVYKKKDTVSGRKRKKELNSLFDNTDEDMITDGGNKYFRDKKGNIFSIEDKAEKKQITTEYNSIKSYVAPYFEGLDDTFKYDNSQGETKESEGKQGSFFN